MKGEITQGVVIGQRMIIGDQNMPISKLVFEAVRAQKPIRQSMEIWASNNT
jgi:hypothetical protein